VVMVGSVLNEVPLEKTKKAKKAKKAK
jgi:hypothetical protein